MNLQNRVAPDGTIMRDPARGMFTGNRGIIHDPETRQLLRRRWTHKAWIICRLEFRGRRRKLMGPGSWTELFFLDEVTALAAGHRPCFECRRDDAMAFADAFSKGMGSGRLKAGEIDAILHGQRLASRRTPPEIIEAAQAEILPPGAMVECRGEFFAAMAEGFLRWNHSGYRPAAAPGERVRLITPPSVLDAFRSGYQPAWHPTARACRDT